MDSTTELLEEIVRANDIHPRDIASVYFTMTPDLNAAFPAAAARALGWTDVALLDAQAPPVPGDLARCIRVLIHWNTDDTRPVRNVYRNGAESLRPEYTRSRSREEDK